MIDDHDYKANTVVAPLDRVKLLFQASNPDFQKYAGA
jgi:solute carrier family 25 (mitochondrial carrier protein), member 16